MSFVTGQAVTVHPSITTCGYYGGIYLNSTMLESKGRKMTVSANSGTRYLMRETPFTWTDEMLMSWEDFAVHGEWTCHNCGSLQEEHEGGFWVNGHKICQDCYDAEYSTCDCCGGVFVTDDGEWSEGEQETVCPTCAHRLFTRCDRCGDLVRNHSAYEMDNGDHLCESCFENHGRTCEDCGRYCYCDNLRENHNGDMVCEDCLSNYSPIGDYHHTRAETFYKLPSDTTNRYIGFELEVEEKRGDKVKAAMNVLETLNHRFIECKHDGSLNDGFEIVSQPATYHYHLGVDYKSAFAGLVRDGMESHNPGTCGLHFHVSKAFFGEGETQYTNIAKLIVMLDKLWEDIVRFSRRNYHDLNDWSKKNPLPQKASLKTQADAGDIDRDTIEEILYDNSGNRYQAINITNRHTVEFRFMRGTLREKTFRASMEFVHLFTNYAVAHSMTECFSATWGDIFRTATSNFKEYTLSQGIGVPEYDHDDN